MTKLSARFATLVTLVTISLLPPSAFAKGGGHSAAARLAPASSKPTVTRPERKTPALSDTTAPQKRPPVVTKYVCTSKHGCAHYNQPIIIRDHRAQPGTYIPHGR